MNNSTSEMAKFTLVIWFLSSLLFVGCKNANKTADTYSLQGSGSTHKKTKNEYTTDSEFTYFDALTALQITKDTVLIELKVSEDIAATIDSKNQIKLIVNATNQTTSLSEEFQKNYSALLKNSAYLKIPCYDTTNYQLDIQAFLLPSGEREVFTWFKSNQRHSKSFIQIRHVGNSQVDLVNYDKRTVNISSPLNANDTLALYVFRGYQYPSTPPYSTRRNIDKVSKPDTVFFLQLDEYGRTNFPNTDQQNLYYISTWPVQNDGVLISYFYPEYPRPKLMYQMVPCLRYILTREEFEAISNSKFKQQDFERIWTSFAGGDKERARLLINKYYARVTHANKYFTSTKEGWQTDRGMIYCVYGKPSSIKKNNDKISWSYGIDQGVAPITFIFEKRVASLSNNDYVLVKSSLSRPSWYENVKAWRAGKPLN